MSTNSYSIVIPIYNEEENLPELYNRLTDVMTSLQEPYEVIFVDDGSKDNSLNIMREMHQRDKRIKTISLSRNFGHQIAISAGIEYARGKAVIVMDGDLQDPPEVLPPFIQKWKEGWDAVYAIRRKRKENLLKRAAYAIFYRLLKKISSIDIPLDSGDFSIMDRKIVDILKSMPERTRFVRGIRTWVGFKQVGLEYERDKRFAGKPKYNFKKLVKLALDGLISFSYVPLKLAVSFGFVISGVSFLGAIATLFQRLFTDTTVPGYATTVISILFLGGIQLITIGILGEYIGRIYDEVKQRPLYIIQEIIGFDEQ